MKTRTIYKFLGLFSAISFATANKPVVVADKDGSELTANRDGVRGADHGDFEQGAPAFKAAEDENKPNAKWRQRHAKQAKRDVKKSNRKANEKDEDNSQKDKN